MWCGELRRESARALRAAAVALLASGALAATACSDDVPTTIAPDGLGGGPDGAGGASPSNDAGPSPWATRDAANRDDAGGSGFGGFGGFGGPGNDAGRPDPAQFNCPDVPTAYVLEYADPY